MNYTTELACLLQLSNIMGVSSQPYDSNVSQVLKDLDYLCGVGSFVWRSCKTS